MKLKPIWISRLDGSHAQVEGHYFGDGLFAAYRHDEEWLLQHIPSGFNLGGKFSYSRLKEARQAALALRKLTIFDWYDTSLEKNVSINIEIVDLMRSVAQGFIEPEHFAPTVMQLQLGQLRMEEGRIK